MEVEDVDENEKLVTVSSLTNYVIGLCRVFKLFPSVRTTVISRNEEMQILQLCSSNHSKKACLKFDAKPKMCEKLHSEMTRQRIIKLEDRLQAKFFASEVQSEDRKRDANYSDLNEADKDNAVLSIKEQEIITCPEMENTSSETENVETEVEVDSTISFVSSLFLDSLKSSNHCSLLGVLELFLEEVVNKESKLYTFVKSNFKKTDLRLCESLPLRKIEILVLKVLKSISGIEDNEDEDEPNSQLLNSSQCSKTPHHIVNSPQDNRSHDMMLLMSPSAIRVKDTPTRSKTAKTPVQVFKSKHLLLSPLPGTPITPSTDVERQQVQRKFIESIFRCYLHLLVNTRCELALAFVFNIPERELSHEAFTHLKHASSVSGLSMYQTLSSFLMRVRLRGNGYAPATDSPLLSYIKGLGCLLDLVDKLQTVIEESFSPRSGCKRVVNILKRSISSCKSRRFPSSVVESVAGALWDILDDILSDMEKNSGKTNSIELETQGESVGGQESIDAFQKYLDQSATCVSDVDRFFLGDVRFSQDTPTRFPGLVSLFRSPLSNGDAEKEDDFDGSSTTTNSEAFRRPVSKVSEALYLDNDDDDKIVCTPLDLSDVYVIPSKTIVHPKCGADYGDANNDLFSPAKNIIRSKGQNQTKRRPQVKRKKKNDIAGNIENQQVDTNSPQPKSRKSLEGISDAVCDNNSNNKSVEINDSVNSKAKGSELSKKQNKSCRRKLLPQIKGQSKLIGFFKA